MCTHFIYKQLLDLLPAHATTARSIPAENPAQILTSQSLTGFPLFSWPLLCLSQWSRLRNAARPHPLGGVPRPGPPATAPATPLGGESGHLLYPNSKKTLCARCGNSVSPGTSAARPCWKPTRPGKVRFGYDR